MELIKYNENIYYTTYEEERDRPSLGYIKGSKFNIAIDAGHSDKHVQEFYDLLKTNNLDLPLITIITHWHWDHSFGIHAVNGITIASKKTNIHLLDFISNQNTQNDLRFKQLDPSIALEYQNNKEIIVKTSDISFENELIINNGIQDIRIFECISPHSDDATFIYLTKDKVLFIGDGKCGVFPTWKSDKNINNQLISQLQTIDFKHSIGGHWPIETKTELIQFLKDS